LNHRKLKAGASKTPVPATTESTEPAKWTIVLITTLAIVGVLVASVGVLVTVIAGVGVLVAVLASVGRLATGVSVSTLACTGVCLACTGVCVSTLARAGVGVGASGGAGISCARGTSSSAVVTTSSTGSCTVVSTIQDARISTRFAISSHCEVNGVIEGTMLGDGNQDRLMVGRRVDGGEFIRTSGETSSNVGCELAIGSRSIQSLEKRTPSGLLVSFG